MKKLLLPVLIILLLTVSFALGEENGGCGYSLKNYTGNHLITWTCQNGWLTPDTGGDVSYIASPCPMCGQGKKKKEVRQLSGQSEAFRSMMNHIERKRQLQMKATGAVRTQHSMKEQSKD